MPVWLPTAAIDLGIGLIVYLVLKIEVKAIRRELDILRQFIVTAIEKGAGDGS